MRTSVIVAKTERRGSFSSPASMAPISWRISPAMRSWRCPATVIWLEHFQIVVDEVSAQQIFRFREDSLQGLLKVGGIVREGDDANLSALQGVLVIEFGYGH